MNFTASYQTVAGLLTITAVQNNEGDTVATFTDRTGSWTKEFFCYTDFKNYLKTLQVVNKLKVSESNTTAVVSPKTAVKTKKVSAPKLSTKKELAHFYMAAKRGKGNLNFIYSQILKVYSSKLNKYSNSKNTSLDSLAKELKISTLEVEMLAVAHKHSLVHTVSGTYVQK